MVEDFGDDASLDQYGEASGAPSIHNAELPECSGLLARTLRSYVIPMPQPPRRPFQKKQARRPGPPPAGAEKKGPAKDQGWDPVAAWYDKLVGETGMDYHRNVILPAALRILDPKAGESIIDICCGQGVLVKPLLDAGVAKVTGVDA
ncbi:MAG: class I SAM-dependent methyltransferase, partial [Verrucomicrobiaceae bacterium]